MWAHELANQGFVCLVIDYPLVHTREYSTDPYAMGYASATMKGIVNHRRGVDVLQSLPYVSRDAIGVIGHSLGGHNALFLASFDERVRAIVSSCGFNVFAIAGGDIRAWSSRPYMPRIKTIYGDDPARMPFDFTEVLAGLAAPGPCSSMLLCMTSPTLKYPAFAPTMFRPQCPSIGMSFTRRIS